MLSIRTAITVPGYHTWEDAPLSTIFLASRHRHLFTFKAELQVVHGDRDVEFFALQDEMRGILAHEDTELLGLLDPAVGVRMSCEAMAEAMASMLEVLGFTVLECSVSEDGESEGIWRRE